MGAANEVAVSAGRSGERTVPVRMRQLRLSTAAILGGLLLFTGCPPPGDSYLQAGDLVGVWDAVTDRGATSLVFQAGDASPTFELRAPLFGEEPLVWGQWYLAGNVISFEDLAGLIACFEIDDRYQVTMLDEGHTIMELTHLNDGCSEREVVLEDVLWVKQEAQENS